MESSYTRVYTDYNFVLYLPIIFALYIEFISSSKLYLWPPKWPHPLIGWNNLKLTRYYENEENVLKNRISNAMKINKLENMNDITKRYNVVVLSRRKTNDWFLILINRKIFRNICLKDISAKDTCKIMQPCSKRKSASHSVPGANFFLESLSTTMFFVLISTFRLRYLVLLYSVFL